MKFIKDIIGEQRDRLQETPVASPVASPASVATAAASPQPQAEDPLPFLRLEPDARVSADELVFDPSGPSTSPDADLIATLDLEAAPAPADQDPQPATGSEAGEVNFSAPAAPEETPEVAETQIAERLSDHAEAGPSVEHLVQTAVETADETTGEAAAEADTVSADATRHPAQPPEVEEPPLTRATGRVFQRRTPPPAEEAQRCEPLPDEKAPQATLDVPPPMPGRAAMRQLHTQALDARPEHPPGQATPAPSAPHCEGPAERAEPAARTGRAGRVKTRLLGFGQGFDAQQDPLSGTTPAPTAELVRCPVGWIAVITGPGRGATFALGSGVSTIGRAVGQSVQLDFGDTSISRENHAALAYDPETRGFYLGHGGKANLVRLNGKPVLSTETLHTGDEIRIGETCLRFVALCGDSFDWGAGVAAAQPNQTQQQPFAQDVMSYADPR